MRERLEMVAAFLLAGRITGAGAPNDHMIKEAVDAAEKLLAETDKRHAAAEKLRDAEREAKAAAENAKRRAENETRRTEEAKQRAGGAPE